MDLGTRVQMYVDLLASIPHHPQLTLSSGLVKSIAASRTTRRMPAMLTRSMFTLRFRRAVVDDNSQLWESEITVGTLRVSNKRLHFTDSLTFKQLISTLVPATSSSSSRSSTAMA